MTATPTWEVLLQAPGACDHLVQLYTDDGFLARVVTRFVGAGFAAGEAAVIIATPAHIALFADRLPDVAGARTRRQLVFRDARDYLTSVMVDGMPDREAFVDVITDALDRVRAAGYQKIRLYGEIVNLLWEQDALEPAARLEELWNELLGEQRVALLCAYRMDNFDRYAHRNALARISQAHSHMIPVDDYERFDRAVDRAYADVFGRDGDAQMLRDLLVTTLGPASVMPRAQAALLALRDVNAHTADAVLDRARQYYSEEV
jgi:hypothetical protein